MRMVVKSVADKLKQQLKLIDLLTSVTSRGGQKAANQHSPSNSVLCNPFQLIFILLMSPSDSRYNVFFGLLHLRFLSAFQVIACHIMQFFDFHNVCSITLDEMLPHIQITKNTLLSIFLYEFMFAFLYKLSIYRKLFSD
ncbi:unnamed protein product [Schistosoma intercalatum]|nr:unnamed protein product [Schistosoma intercalatum]CAH8598857.1 unnamed protein product [Schistosoma intercalatum]